MKKIDIGFAPPKNIQNGLLALFDRDTKTEKDYAFADVIKGQRKYDLPKDKRKLRGIFLKCFPKPKRKHPRKSRKSRIAYELQRHSRRRRPNTPLRE